MGVSPPHIHFFFLTFFHARHLFQRSERVCWTSAKIDRPRIVSLTNTGEGSSFSVDQRELYSKNRSTWRRHGALGMLKVTGRRVATAPTPSERLTRRKTRHHAVPSPPSHYIPKLQEFQTYNAPKTSTTAKRCPPRGRGRSSALEIKKKTKNRDPPSRFGPIYS